MSSQQALIDVSLSLNTNRKKEKLAAFENLTDLLNQERLVKSLHKNSKDRDKHITWDILFIRVHRAVLSFVDEILTKSKQIFDKHLQLLQNVIIQVTKKSVCQNLILVDNNILVSSVLAVFESDIRIKFLGTTYLNLLSNYVISHGKHWCILKEEYWNDIKNLCLKYFYNPPQGTHCKFFLETLTDLIRCSSKNSQISHIFLDLFNFLKNIYFSYKGSRSNIEIALLHLTNTMCLHLAIEFRYKVCEFMEDVFNCVISFHERKKPDKNLLVYHFLMTTLNLHNPNGVHMDDKCFYASNLSKWKSQIKKMYLFCIEEVTLILKNPEMQIEMDFLNLFVDVLHLVKLSEFESWSEIGDHEVIFCDPGPDNKRKSMLDSQNLNGLNFASQKRRKFDGCFVNLLQDLQTSDAWFWLKYLELQLLKYPSDLKNDYYQIIQILYQLICDKRDVQITSNSLRCLCHFIENESSFELSMTVDEVQLFDVMWKKISIELLRFLQNDFSSETHSLLRALISHAKLHDVGPFIKLYSNGILHPNVESFKTFSVICQHYIIPEVIYDENCFINSQKQYENTKELLLLWLLQKEDLYACKDLTKALISLILKRFEEEFEKSVSKEDILISRVNINDFCKLIINNYMSVAFKNIKFVEDTKVIENSFEVRVDYNMKNKLFGILDKRCQHLINGLNNESQEFCDQLKALKNTLWFCELLGYLLSQFEFMKASVEDKNFFIEKLQTLLGLCTTKGLNLIQVKNFDLTCFSNLYSARFHRSVQNKIREPNFTNLNFLKYLFKLFEGRSTEDVADDDSVKNVAEEVTSNSRFSQLITNPHSALHFQNLIVKEKIVINIAEFLCQYITVLGYADCNHYQSTLSIKLIENLIGNAYFDADSSFQKQLVLRVVCILSKFQGISVQVLNGCLDLLTKILSGNSMDLELIITMLQILTDISHLVHQIRNADAYSKFLKLIDKFRVTIVVKKYCGIKAVFKFIDCLTGIAKLDLEGSWAFLERNNENSKIFEENVNFFKHPFREVRLAAARHIGLLFLHDKNMKNSTVMWQKRMLKTIFDMFSNDENIFTKEKGFVSEYINYTDSSIVLILWASIICLSNYWRKEALFYLLHLAFLKNIKKSEVEDILILICKELKISSVKKYISSNFLYLFYKWTKEGLKIEDFPFNLLECKTVVEFLQNNFPVIVTVYSHMGQIGITNQIATKLDKTVGYIIKDSFPVLMSFILPSLSDETCSQTTQEAQKLKRFIDNELPSKTFMKYLMEYLDQVIFFLVRYMHDPEYLLSLCEFFGNLEDDKIPWSFNTPQIVETMKNLSVDEDMPLLGKVALQAPSVIQRVLLLLFRDVEFGVVYEDKIFAFYKYIFFVELISKATNKDSAYHDINCFVIRDVIYTTAAIIRKDENQVLITMAYKCLRILFESYLTEFSELIEEFLPTITSTLKPLAIKSDGKALNLLQFLICENYSKLKSAVVSLDSFPSDAIFKKINEIIESKQENGKTLKNAVKHFIKSGISQNTGCKVETLKHLHKLLSECKTELKEMYENLRLLRGFSEDCKDSLLHQLICMLVELSLDKNMTVRIQAVNCLGELGPCDLTTLVLKPENNFNSTGKDFCPIRRLFKSSVNILSNLLISDNYDVRNASSKALYAILSTSQGREIIRNSGSKKLEYLSTFVSDSGDSFQIKILRENFSNKIKVNQLWTPDVHEKWIVNLVKAFLDSLFDSCDVFNSFKEVLLVDWHFSESIFPLILDLILTLDDNECREIIGSKVNMFFEENFHHKRESSVIINKTSCYCMVNAVDYIRIQRNHEGIYQQSLLNVNYLQIAKAALYCSAYFTSIFYSELWFEEKRKTYHTHMDINTICEMFPEEGFALTKILRECYSKIGSSDGLHGCSYIHLLDVNAEIQHFEQLKNWNYSTLHHDIQLSSGNKPSEVGLINSLERCGMFFTVNNLAKFINSSSQISSVQYRCAAKLCDWSLLDSKSNNIDDSFDKCQYFTLKAFHNNDTVAFQNELHKARKIVLNELSHCSLESTKNLYLPMTQLQCLKELEEFTCTVQNSNRNGLQNIYRKWNKHDDIKCSEFRLVESILTNRTILIKEELEKVKDFDLKTDLNLMLCETYFKLVVLARKEKKYETAMRNLNYLASLNNIPEDVAGKLKMEKARIFWEIGEKEMGRFLLSHFLKRNEIAGELKSKGLRIYGDWMATTKVENSRHIIENYYLKSIALSNNTENRIDTFASLAKFADSNYKQLDEYLSSPLFEIKQNLISTQQDLATELRQELVWNQSREKRMAYQIAAKQCAIDENEIKNCKSERDSYLNLALKYYLLSLKEGDKYNLLIFRVISLWLSNTNNQDIIKQLQKKIHEIPTYKFLCLLPQLVPRMADVCLISDLIERILQDHPQHILPVLFALSNSFEDLKYSNLKSTPCTSRVLAARSILEKFEKNNTTLESSIVEMQHLSRALIEVANYKPPEKERPGSAINFPEHLKIRRIKNLKFVCVPTLQIPYNKNCNYSNITGIYKFDESYYLVGGVNVPKKINCIGLDGISRPLLVKGKDDLRQDAVMQQVFTIMNSLLQQNTETNKRKLIIRTYKVVPLSQRSGIIEWCENTQPLSLYLVGPDGKSGAHKRFSPDDIEALECRTLMRKVFAQPEVTNEDKLKVFLEICEKFHPVFHYFFIEKFPAAGVWFERRLAYIHSVATSSMIGYILGIGDRHVHNILIDNASAEVIHIDLGIAFEQGKTLPTPETVPFRLTRDIVDGMGLSGIEGDFRISCVKTMEVLRNNRDTILTLLEVLLYDPLYAWTITPEKAYSIQCHTETSSTATEKSSPDLETNKIAERALIRLKQKLQGTETGCIVTNVEGQVNYLIQQARDPNNLCRLFHGWQPYL